MDDHDHCVTQPISEGSELIDDRIADLLVKRALRFTGENDRDPKSAHGPGPHAAARS